MEASTGCPPPPLVGVDVIDARCAALGPGVVLVVRRLASKGGVSSPMSRDLRVMERRSVLWHPRRHHVGKTMLMLCCKSLAMSMTAR